MTRATAYRHAQTYTMLWIILLLSSGLAAQMVALHGKEPAASGLFFIALSLLAGLLLLGRLVITVDEQAVRWSFGYVGWPGWHVPLKDIASTEVAKANVAFGSGIKGSARHRQYNVVSSGPALRLHLMDGRSITLGTPEPARLQGFIEARLDRSLR
jgi:hypothetical protein